MLPRTLPGTVKKPVAVILIMNVVKMPKKNTASAIRRRTEEFKATETLPAAPVGESAASSLFSPFPL